MDVVYLWLCPFRDRSCLVLLPRLPVVVQKKMVIVGHLLFVVVLWFWRFFLQLYCCFILFLFVFCQRFIPHFKAEEIGILELPYMTEQRLQNLGIPLGPRLRILEEIQNLR